MRLSFKYTNLAPSPAFEDHIDKKLEPIRKITKGLDPGGNAFIYIEIARTTRHHNKGDVYAVDTNLHLPKKTFRVLSKGENLERAVEGLTAKLKVSVEKYKIWKWKAARGEWAENKVYLRWVSLRECPQLGTVKRQ